jgi:RimJ/RimL family protein N-acetyltransferase
VIIDGNGFRLRPLTLADADAWLAGEDDEMRRGFEFPRASTREDVLGAIEGWTASWLTGGPIRKWAITDAATGAIMGGVELRPVRGHIVVARVEVAPVDGEELNLSYEVFPKWRRRGFASQAARLAIHYAATEMKVSRIMIRILPENAASLGVARRLGANQIGTAPSPSGATHLVFQLLATR